MKKKEVLMLILCCVPWFFLTLYADRTYGIAWQYGLALGIMAVAAGVLADNGKMLILGNGFSFGISVLMVKWVGFDAMSDYFKPFGAFGWVAVLTAVSAVMQMLVWKKNQTDDR